MESCFVISAGPRTGGDSEDGAHLGTRFPLTLPLDLQSRLACTAFCSRAFGMVSKNDVSKCVSWNAFKLDFGSHLRCQIDKKLRKNEFWTWSWKMMQNVMKILTNLKGFWDDFGVIFSYFVVSVVRGLAMHKSSFCIGFYNVCFPSTFSQKATTS